MLQLQHISLVQFKNYLNRSFEFREKIIGITGPNGIGKTNLLDAIYYLGFTRSYFSRTDAQNVQHDKNGFRIEGRFDLNGEPQKVVCILRENGRKEISLNESVYEKFSQHIGRFPCVMIAPDDIAIITGASDERRRFIDTLLSQTESGYLQWLIDYNRVLQQRNSYLRTLDGRAADEELIQVYDQQLAEPGTRIFQCRQQFFAGFISLVTEFYQLIAGFGEKISFEYKSQLLSSPLKGLLENSREKDRFLQRTTAGIHRDDLNIFLAGEPFKTLASQGQRKTLLFALKLAEFESLKKAKGFAPILLLDDVFEKLDAGRMKNLLNWVVRENEGQIFITDTHRDRMEEHLRETGGRFEVLEV